jgi:dihydrofolate reductase
LLVHLPDDLRRFKRITLGTPIVMGRKTWQSIGRPLPGRRNIVVSRDPSFQAAGAETLRSFDAALAAAESAPLVHVIGGAAIYAAAMPVADELQLTEIDAEYPADTFFPEWDRSRFELVSREPHETPDGLRYAFATYRRLASG